MSDKNIRYPRRAVTTKKSMLGPGTVVEQKHEFGDWHLVTGSGLWHWKYANDYLNAGLWIETFDHHATVSGGVAT